MEWQNLITKECPKCRWKLGHEGDIGFKCSNAHCDFFITRRKYAEIISDPTHNFRTHLSRVQWDLLDELNRRMQDARLMVL